MAIPSIGRATPVAYQRPERVAAVPDPGAVSTGRQPVPPPGQPVKSITVVRGDTLAMLSRRYDTTPADIMQLNKLVHGEPISAGQQLMVRAI